MPMNLRVLKKRSKQAAPYLHHFGRNPTDIFLAERGENYHGLNIRCPHKPGRFRCECQYHPLKGTPMTGGMSGYYEPEWSEKTTLEELQDFVIWGDKPATLSDSEWQRVLRITRVKPITAEEMAEMVLVELDETTASA